MPILKRCLRFAPSRIAAENMGAIVLILVLVTLAVPLAQAQTFAVLHTFTGGADGAVPIGLILDRAGNLYGTTQGFENCNLNSPPGICGSVFKLAHKGSGWVLTTLYDFDAGEGGQRASSPPLFGPDGALYATNSFSGTSYGIVFRLAPNSNPCKSASCPWNETVIYSFPGGASGAGPAGALLFDSAGNIFGTTGAGGLNSCRNGGCGTVYELTPSGGGWMESVLYAFTESGGVGPAAGVISDPAGNLYGVAGEGGSGGWGTVFELSPSVSGWTETTLYNFTRFGSAGYLPGNGLMLDASGNLYGGTSYAGSGGGGTAYQLAPSNGSWTLNVVYGFTGSNGPGATFIMDAAGNIYGTTINDGAHGWGNVFKLTPMDGGWTYTDLYDFTGGDDGAEPGSLVRDGAGNLYGTTLAGGTHSLGTVWELTP